METDKAEKGREEVEIGNLSPEIQGRSNQGSDSLTKIRRI